MRAMFSWPWRSAWWLALALALAACFGGWSAHCETSQPPTSEEQLLSPQLEQLLNLPFRTLRDDSLLLVSRLQERRQQAESLQESLLSAGGKLSFSEELSLKLWQSLNEAAPLLESLMTDLTGISSSLSGLQKDVSAFGTSLNQYFTLFQDQIGEVRKERDAARLQASAWRLGALIGGGVAVVSLTALVIVIVVR